MHRHTPAREGAGSAATMARPFDSDVASTGSPPPPLSDRGQGPNRSLTGTRRRLSLRQRPSSRPRCGRPCTSLAPTRAPPHCMGTPSTQAASCSLLRTRHHDRDEHRAELWPGCRRRGTIRAVSCQRSALERPTELAPRKKGVAAREREEGHLLDGLWSLVPDWLSAS